MPNLVTAPWEEKRVIALANACKLGRKIRDVACNEMDDLALSLNPAAHGHAD